MRRDGCDLPTQLLEHPRHRQRRKVWKVEVWTSQGNPIGQQPLSEIRRLRRLRGRGESVQVEDLTPLDTVCLERSARNHSR